MHSKWQRRRSGGKSPESYILNNFKTTGQTAKHFEVWLAMKNYMMHFLLELATILTTMS